MQNARWLCENRDLTETSVNKELHFLFHDDIQKKNLTYIKALSGNFFFFQVLNLLLARTLIGNVRVFCPEQTDPWRTESKTRRKTASAPTQNFATGTDVEQMGQK